VTPGAAWTLALLSLGAAAARPAEPAVQLPPRIREIVIHVPGGPSYTDPARRFRFFTPAQTQALWKPRFGAHWIVWTDGSLWPRHHAAGEPASRRPPADRPADDDWKRRLAAEAEPVYGHLHNGNSHTVGIEVSHSGHSADPFPEAQVRTLAWLLRTLMGMSGGRLTAASIHGHKDLDQRPAYVQERCARPGCAVYVDASGRPFRRRVDPPEGLFEALRREGLALRRPPDGDAELVRTEAIPAGARPAVARP
jgi:N-acetylmuramoyl-L-alanine amidase-like protein